MFTRAATFLGLKGRCVQLANLQPKLGTFPRSLLSKYTALPIDFIFLVLNRSIYSYEAREHVTKHSWLQVSLPEARRALELRALLAQPLTSESPSSKASRLPGDKRS